MTDPIREAKLDLTCALRWSARLNLHEGVCNHFSIAVPGRDDRFLINPQGLHWLEVTPADIVTVDVDGKGMEAAAGASKWHDNVIYSNASLDDAVETRDDGLGGIESRPSGNLPQIATRPGWRGRHVGDVDIEHGDGTRAEHVIRLERID